jgi:preprotein translocase subunit SecF
VGDNSGWGTTLRQTFGAGADALFASVRMIGVIVAFVAPWLFTLALLAWVGRRIYVWKRR